MVGCGFDSSDSGQTLVKISGSVEDEILDHLDSISFSTTALLCEAVLLLLLLLL
jgi:hypothetical protein